VPLYGFDGPKATKQNLGEVQNALQHAAWLAWMYLIYGEKLSNDIAWIHEQLGSDGWSDTIRDFYNNKKGIEIGKEVERRLTPAQLKRLRGEPLGFLEELNSADAGAKAWDMIQEAVVESAEGGDLAMLAVKAYPNIPNYDPTPYLNYIMSDAQRFWDASVSYNPNPGDKKPGTRPTAANQK
jgi:hypothetical protein